MTLSARFYIAFLLGGLVVTTWTGAQEISSPIVRPASIPKPSTDMRTMMTLAPMRIWREGDPVIVKESTQKRLGSSCRRFHLEAA